MDICVMGAGYVGLPLGVVLAVQNPQTKIHVQDINVERIAKIDEGQLPFSEEGLAELFDRVRKNNFKATTELQSIFQSCSVFILCVNTDTKSSGLGAGGALEIKSILSCVEEIGRELSKESGFREIVIVEKSTVPLGTSFAIRKRLEKMLGESWMDSIAIVSNPEFLEEGKALQGLLKPDRIVLGFETNKKSAIFAQKKMSEMYKFASEKIIETDCSSSELGKLSANAFLMTKVTSINALTELCETSGADVGELAKIIGSDYRIGPLFLRSSIGVGGYCLEKDTLCLEYLCRAKGLDQAADYWRRLVEFNRYQKKRFGLKVIEYFDNCLMGKKILVLGVSFKENSEDCRNSPAIEVIKTLLDETGAQIRIVDPHVEKRDFAKEFERTTGRVLDSNKVTFESKEVCPKTWEQLSKEVDALLVLCGHKLFKENEESFAKGLAEGRGALFDGRKLFDQKAMRELGIFAYSVGSP